MPGEPEGIVVLGAPRSGTTLLRRLLDAHPDIACPGETYLLTSCARFLEGERVVDGMEVGVLNGLAFAGFEPEEVLARLRELALGFLREHARRAGKRTWAEKTAVGAFHARALGRLLGGHARFVCIVRHGLDVACSTREWVERSEAHPRELRPYVARHPRPLEAYTHAWVDAMAALADLAAARPDGVVSLRYEDLLEDPDRVLARLLEQLGARPDPGLLERAFADAEPRGFSDWKTYARSALDASSVGRRRSLSRATATELGRIANPTLAAWGYEPVELEPDRTEEELRRRYELGLQFQASRAREPRTPGSPGSSGPPTSA